MTEQITIKRIRMAPIKTKEEEPAKYSSALDDYVLLRCYCCGRIVSKHIRVICRKSGLAICHSCDGKEEKQECPSSPQDRVRSAAVKPIPPEDAMCEFCEKPIINIRKLNRKVKKLKQSALNGKDVERVAQQEKHKGWKYLSHNVYAHTRCLNKEHKNKGIRRKR